MSGPPWKRSNNQVINNQPSKKIRTDSNGHNEGKSKFEILHKFFSNSIIFR